MGKGFWYGDKSGGNTYRGDISDLSIDGAGHIVFDYTYTHGATGGGRFKGDITGNRLIGSWEETCDGLPRAGIVNMKRTNPAKLQQMFKGAYGLKTAVPKTDDEGDWAIEFDV